MANTEVGSGEQRASRIKERHPRIWLVVACCVLVIGIGGSITAAALWRASGDKAERQTFESTATAVTTALDTELQGDADFVSTVRAVLTLEPPMSTSRFQTWLGQLQGAQRQEGTLGTLVITSVARKHLKSFLAKRDADPAFSALVGGKARTLAQVRGRSRYCVLSAAASPVALGDFATALQGEWCNPRSPIIGGGPLELREATDSGQFLVAPASADGTQSAYFDAAFYRRGARRSTVRERRRAVRGWIVSSFDVNSLISKASAAYRGLEVSLYHTNPGGQSELVGRVGHHSEAGLYTRSSRVNIEGAWTVVVRSPPIARGLSAGVQGALLLGGGSLVSVLVSLLIFLLSRGRARALGMVEEKSGELRHQALHDLLTGLPNRALALDRAEQMLARARRRQLPVVALYADIDNLRQVNDRFGHGVGDECVQIVADRLRSLIREGDTVARVDGDEFVLLLEGPVIDREPRLVAERLLEVIRQPLDLTRRVDRQLSLTVSVGIAEGIGKSAELLLANANIAQTIAKSSGKAQCVVFESGMQQAAEDRVALRMDLEDALAKQQLFLLYQPIIDLHDDRPIGVEALLRWRHPERGIVSPSVFIPLAEESGAIVPIGKWVLQEACRQAADWSERGHMLQISVNVSARQLDRDELIEDVRRALVGSGLTPSALTVEVTESALMRDADATARRLFALKELGVRIAIDDFGTGYSSLAYLRQFPVDQLKIDRSFIQGVAGSRQAAALVHSLVYLGKSLELETLAEGIEDDEQLAEIQRQKCDSGQGFLFARPLEPDAVIEFVESARTSNHPGALV